MTNSHISTGPGGTMFAGPDAIKLYQAKTLATFLRLYAKSGIIPTRGVTITKMLASAHALTGKRYKRGDAVKAAADLDHWSSVMLSALPVTNAED